MAITSPRLWRRKAILIKSEVTYGTDSIPTGIANAIEVRNFSFTPMKNTAVEQVVERAYMGNGQEIVTGTQVQLNFDVAVTGSGAPGVAPAFSPLHLASGFSQTIAAAASVTYNLISAAFGSATIYVNIDGVLHKMLGCRGDRDVKLTGGSVPVYSYKFTGLYGGIADAALPAMTMTSWQQPVAVNNVNTSLFSVDGVSMGMYDLTITGGSTISHRADLVGTEDVLITDRKMTGSLVIQAPTTQAEKDFWAGAKSALIVPITVTHGTIAGNRVKFDLKAQLKDPTYVDKNGITAMQFSLRMVPTGAGNDELTETIT